MKQKIYVLGITSALIIFTGTLFKVNHWPAAGILVGLGIFILVFVFLPLALINNYRAEGNRQNKILYWVTWMTCLVVFVAMVFKIMHWPGAEYALFLALPFPYIIFLPVFLIVTSKNKKFSIYNTVFILFLLALISANSALLALNVSKERIADSLILSRNYNKLKNELTGLPSDIQESSLNQKIDEALKIIKEYRYRILRHENITGEQWAKDPESLHNPDSPDIVPAVLMGNGELTPEARLEIVLNELVMLTGQTKGTDVTANTLPVMLGLVKKKETEPGWTYMFIKATNLSWILINLDSLETNLLMLKASI